MTSDDRTRERKDEGRGPERSCWCFGARSEEARNCCPDAMSNMMRGMAGGATYEELAEMIKRCCPDATSGVDWDVVMRRMFGDAAERSED